MFFGFRVVFESPWKRGSRLWDLGGGYRLRRACDWILFSPRFFALGGGIVGLKLTKP